MLWLEQEPIAPGIPLPAGLAGCAGGLICTRYGIDPSPASGSSSATDAPAPAGAQDPRLGLMRRSWFEGKKCLDVGCNEGYLTLALVRSFRPRRMVGVDIDSYLVQRARRALLAEMNGASHANERAAFRPLMPRSLRGGGDGGGARAGRSTTSIAVDACSGGTPSRASKGTAKRPRQEQRKASAGGGEASASEDIGSDADCNTSTSAGAAELEVSRKKGGDGRRQADKSDAEGSMLPEAPGAVTTCGTSGSRADRGSCGPGAPQRAKSNIFEGSIVDAATDAHGPSTDETAAAAAAAAGTAAAAAGGVCVADADTKVLSGCAVSFQCEDFVAEDHGDHGYDVVCLFSIVKWIHINGGDETLRRVFRKAHGLLQRGGRLILEPQPWKSYRKSARQHGSAEARAIVGKIKLRPSDFPALLTEEVGFRSWEEVGLPAEGVGGFAKRSVHVFVK